MLRKVRSRFVPIAAAALLLVGSVGAVNGANPNASYSFTACWDDGTASGTQGVRGRQVWSAIRVNAVSVGFEGFLGADYYTIPGSRTGDETSGWLTPQTGYDTLVGALYNGRRVVATSSIDKPVGGWSTLSPCPVVA